MIKFSILIPAFKKKFLKEAISSCLAQTYSHFEVIIVDDCSPEDLKSVVDAFDDSRIYYFRNERNYGAINVVDNWNTCLDFSTGDYVICIGDDDMLAPAALREYVCLINKYPKVDLLHSRTLIVDENSDPIELTLARPELEDQYSFMYARMKGRKMFIGDYCFRASTLRQGGGFYKLPLAWMSDDITTFISAKNGVANVNIPTFMYRQNMYTITSKGAVVEKMKAIMLAKEWYENFLYIQNPKNQWESLMLKQLINDTDLYFNKLKAASIATDIKKDKFRVFMWIVRKKYYKLSYTTIAKGFVLSCKF